MSDLDFQKTIWMSDASKAEKLRNILRDPVFTEAVNLALSLNPPQICGGVTGIQDTALDGARFNGMGKLLQALKEVSHLTAKEPEEPKPRQTPWGHFTKERSAFAPPPTTPPTKPNSEPTNPK